MSQRKVHPSSCPGISHPSTAIRRKALSMLGGRGAAKAIEAMQTKELKFANEKCRTNTNENLNEFYALFMQMKLKKRLKENFLICNVYHCIIVDVPSVLYLYANIQITTTAADGRPLRM